VVIAASSSFCKAFSIDPAHVVGRPLAELGQGEWGMPRLGSLLNATAAGSAEIEAYELDLIRPGQPPRNLVVHAQVLADGETETVRLLLAVTDVTTARAEARLKDDLIRDKAILVQEVQHRIANSLQIIASVLMQGARRVQSEEARGYLQNAHHRVMSIETVQRQLSVAEADEVILRDYLTQLSESLSASMIADPDRVILKVKVDDSVVPAADSVSLGLIVTELVINALKHAFPGDRAGMISVNYVSQDGDWTLSVIDDGIGIGTGPTAPTSGLGTSIVEALARNLDADVSINDARPGTMVRITHRATAGTGDDSGAAL
jgi:two-component sensor histidine kinase